MKQTPVMAILVLAATVAVPPLAAAQSPTNSPSPLSLALNAGDTGWLTDSSGREFAVEIGGGVRGATGPASMSGEGGRLARERRPLGPAALGSPSASSRACGNWMCRHPVWFGTIVGAVGGAAIAGAVEGAEASFVGFYVGAGAGAIVGWIVAVSR